MKRNVRAVLTLLALAGIGGLGCWSTTYSDISETQTGDYFPSQPIAENISPAQNPPIDFSSSTQRFDAPAPPPQQTVARETVVEWIAQISDADTRKRAAAIDALAIAPKSEAVPALHRVLNGGANVDRQLALNSLRTLALNQGDTEGEIREVLRLVIYDGDDEAIAMSAQATLAEIERGIN